MVKRYAQLIALMLLLSFCSSQAACVADAPQGGSNCLTCSDQTKCTSCAANFFLNSTDVGNMCKGLGDLAATEGLNKTNTPFFISNCTDKNCLNCKHDITDCQECSPAASYLEYVNKNCTLIAPEAKDDAEVFPVYKTASINMALRFSDDKKGLEIFFFKTLTQNKSPKLTFSDPVMGDNRVCKFCGQTSAYKFDSRLAATEGLSEPYYDKYTAYLGFSKAFPIKEFTLRYFGDTTVNVTPSSFQSTVQGNAEDLKITDTFYKTHTSEVISWWLKIWNFCTMTGLMIVFPMSSYFINQMFSFFGYVRVLSGPGAMSTGIVLHYLTSDAIWPFYVPNPYTSSVADSACPLLSHHVQNALTCNIIGNFGHIFNKMAAALVINIVVFLIFRAWTKRAEEQDLTTNWFLVRIRKYWGLRYFYQFMDAYNYELLGYIFLNFARASNNNISGLVLSIVLLFYYLVFYGFALFWMISVKREAAARSSTHGHNAPDHMDELRSLYDSDFAFLLERYKPRQNFTFTHLMPFIWLIKNLIVQIIIVVLESYGTAQLIIVLIIEFFWVVAVMLTWGKKFVHDNLYDAAFGVFHVVFLILKVISEARGLERTTMEDSFGVALASFLLMIGLITIIHSVLVIIGDLLYLCYGETRTRAMRRGKKADAKDYEEKAPIHATGKIVPSEVRPYRR